MCHCRNCRDEIGHARLHQRLHFVDFEFWVFLLLDQLPYQDLRAQSALPSTYGTHLIYNISKFFLMIHLYWYFFVCVCVFMLISLCVCLVYFYVCVCVSVCVYFSICVFVLIFVYLCLFLCVWECVSLCLFVYMCMCFRAYFCGYVFVQICMCVSMCLYVCVCHCVFARVFMLISMRVYHEMYIILNIFCFTTCRSFYALTLFSYKASRYFPILLTPHHQKNTEFKKKYCFRLL